MRCFDKHYAPNGAKKQNRDRHSVRADHLRTIVLTLLLIGLMISVSVLTRYTSAQSSDEPSGAAELKKGDYENAIKLLTARLATNPGDAEAETNLARAYLELESAGVVVKRHGSGTYISDTGSPLKRAEKLKILARRADALLADAQHLEVELGELLDLVRERHKAMQSKVQI